MPHSFGPKNFDPQPIPQEAELAKREGILEERERQIAEKNKQLDEKLEQVEKVRLDLVEKLEKVSKMSADDAKQILLEQVEKDLARLRKRLSGISEAESFKMTL